jgi:hypothetical protein
LPWSFISATGAILVPHGFSFCNFANFRSISEYPAKKSFDCSFPFHYLQIQLWKWRNRTVACTRLLLFFSSCLLLSCLVRCLLPGRLDTLTISDKLKWFWVK